MEENETGENQVEDQLLPKSSTPQGVPLTTAALGLLGAGQPYQPRYK